MNTSPVSQQSPGMGIMAPKPMALMADAIKKGQVVEVRPGEPVFVFIEMRPGSGTSIKNFNKRSPFKMSLSRPPVGVPVPRTMGSWYRIELGPGAKVGQKDRVAVVTKPVVAPGLQVKGSAVPFTLCVGAMRYY